jgi:hypothetical protein
MNWLPEHKCGLFLEHNAHKDVYETIEEFYDPGAFVSEKERLKAVEANSVWKLQWYPDTPVGFILSALQLWMHLKITSVQGERHEHNT